MLTYKYSAMDDNNNIVKGKIQAQSEGDARKILVADGKKIIRIKMDFNESLLSTSTERSISIDEVAHFCKQMHLITKSGISLIKGLLMVRNQASNKKILNLSENVYTNVQKGYSMSDAFKNSGYKLPVLLTNMIQIGEITGNMADVFKKMNGYFQKESKTRKKIINSAIYPIILFCACLGVIVLFLFKILPDMVGTINDVGGELPQFTIALMNVSQFLQNNYIFILLGLIIFFGFIRWGVPETIKEKIKNYVLFEFPAIKTVSKDLITSRFLRTMGVLINTGLSLLVVLDTLESAMGSKIISKKVHYVKEKVSEGDLLSKGLERMNFFDTMVINIVAIGEETGNLGDSLLDLADYYEEKFDTGVTKLISLAEPMIILFMGGIIAAILLSVMLPMFDMISSFRNMGA